RVALALARGVRPRADARAARPPRRSAARVSVDPRRRHERQVDGGKNDRGTARRGGACRRRLPLAACDRLERADQSSRGRGGLRARGRAYSPAGRGASRHAVRGAHRGGAREAAEAFRGRAIDTEPDVELPGRWEVRGEEPLEVWDGAHNPAGAEYLANRAAGREWVLVASVLEDKDIEAMLRMLSGLG